MGPEGQDWKLEYQDKSPTQLHELPPEYVSVVLGVKETQWAAECRLGARIECFAHMEEQCRVEEKQAYRVHSDRDGCEPLCLTVWRRLTFDGHVGPQPAAPVFEFKAGEGLERDICHNGVDQETQTEDDGDHTTEQRRTRKPSVTAQAQVQCHRKDDDGHECERGHRPEEQSIPVALGANAFEWHTLEPHERTRQEL